MVVVLALVGGGDLHTPLFFPFILVVQCPLMIFLVSLLLVSCFRHDLLGAIQAFGGTIPARIHLPRRLGFFSLQYELLELGITECIAFAASRQRLKRMPLAFSYVSSSSSQSPIFLYVSSYLVFKDW